MNDQTPAPSFWDRNRILIKGFIIGFLILLMLIPAIFISNLVYERQSRQTEVINEVSSKWADEQTVTGPVLVVPYRQFTTSADGKTTTATDKTAYLLPETLNVVAAMQPEVRHRSIFDVILYRSGMDLSGNFNLSTLNTLDIPAQNIMWQNVRLVVGLNDLRGLEEQVTLNWNGTKSTFEPGVGDNKVIKQGLNASVLIDSNAKATFNINVKVKGSGKLYFTPVGKITEVTMSAPWQDPAFDGAYLPSETPVLTEKGFTAKWKILPGARQYPQCWKDYDPDLGKSAFGVKLLQPVDGYAKTQRSTKYAILFIALTFIIFFFLEILQKRNVHPLQYVLVGFALSIFYTLLLSISEYTGFNTAYFIATTATVSLIGMYVWNMFKNIRTAIIFTITLAGLYGYIFILIQLQDYALLFGSIGLFLMLAVIMYYSRKIDWYGTHTENALSNGTQKNDPKV